MVLHHTVRTMAKLNVIPQIRLACKLWVKVAWPAADLDMWVCVIVML